MLDDNKPHFTVVKKSWIKGYKNNQKFSYFYFINLNKLNRMQKGQEVTNKIETKYEKWSVYHMQTVKTEIKICTLIQLICLFLLLLLFAVVFFSQYIPHYATDLDFTVSIRQWLFSCTVFQIIYNTD